MAIIQGAGVLSERITFQKHIVETDEVGNRLNTWADYFCCWASVSTSKLSVKETNETAQTLEHERLDFIVRYCPQTSVITSTEYRIVFRERIYNIDNVDVMNFKKHALKFSANLVRR